MARKPATKNPVPRSTYYMVVSDEDCIDDLDSLEAAREEAEAQLLAHPALKDARIYKLVSKAYPSARFEDHDA